MTERKPSEERAVLKIPKDLHREIDIEGAVKGLPMYVVVQKAWQAYKSSEGVVTNEEPSTKEGIEAGLTPRQIKLLNRYADFLRSGRDPEFGRVIETVLSRVESSSKGEEHQNRKAG